MNFGDPQVVGARMRAIVAWSRIFNDVELLCAINTDPGNPTTAWVTVDYDLHAAGSQLTCLYSTVAADIGTKFSVEARNGRAILLRAPPAGFVVIG